MTVLPLSERVVAPVDNTPVAVDGVAWRPLVTDDLDALVAATTAIAAADHPTWAETREEIAEELGHSFLSLADDSLAAVTDEGELLAFGLVIMPPGQETLVRSIVPGGVVPDARGRGIGRALLAWQVGRGLQQLAGSSKTLPGWILAGVDDRAVSAGHTFLRAGFEATRWYLSLSRIVAEPIPVVTPADGIRIVPYSADYSAATHAAKDDAFRDHWGSQPSTDEQWESMLGLGTFAPEHSFIALTTDGEVAGLLMTSVSHGDWALQGFSSGYVDLVGVPRAWRGRRIAPALLAAHLRSLRAAGIERSVLDVDSDNPSGALGLYTGMGYVQQDRSANYTRVY